MGKDQQLAKIYMDAVWEYFLEHSDLTKSGCYFVKFHTSNKKEFNKKIVARIRGYHREDPRYGNILEKEKIAQQSKSSLLAKRVKEKPRTTRDKFRSFLIKKINLWV